ncbi:MAG TPA: hypothetical protein VNE18_10465 [Rhodanobacter sp.]|nr:hypothetical protein [Rhodanobacter sp.]
MDIAYSKIDTITNLSKGQTAYKLSTGDIIAVSVHPGRDAAPDMFSVRARAVAIHADGTPVLDHTGKPISAEIHQSCPKTALVEGKADHKTMAQAAIEQVITGGDGIAAEIAAARAYQDVTGDVL